MSILSQAMGFAAGGVWKIGAIASLTAAVASSAYLGFEWYMAVRDRDAARDELRQVREEKQTLTLAVHDQNVAVSAMAAQTADAEKRRTEAEQKSASAIARIAARSTAVSTSKAKDCTGVLSEAWKGWK